jgi:hypothetical protein
MQSSSFSVQPSYPVGINIVENLLGVLEIHDAVLITAVFSVYNRYADGLRTWQPQDQTMHAKTGNIWRSTAI